MNHLTIYCMLSRFMLFSNCQNSKEIAANSPVTPKTFSPLDAWLVNKIVTTTESPLVPADLLPRESKLLSKLIEVSKKERDSDSVGSREVKGNQNNEKVQRGPRDPRDQRDPRNQPNENRGHVAENGGHVTKNGGHVTGPCRCGDVIGYFCATSVDGVGRRPGILTGDCVANGIYQCQEPMGAAVFLQHCPGRSQCVPTATSGGVDQCISQWFRRLKMRLAIRF